MKYRIVVDPRVHDQLRQACRWWAEHHSAEQAERWYNGFADAIQTLGDNPHRHGLAPENESFPIEVRNLLYGIGHKPTHRALFAIRPDMVYVFSVRHLAQKPLTPDDLS
jgi:plasmid stabilization system protein ParE